MKRYQITLIKKAGKPSVLFEELPTREESEYLVAALLWAMSRYVNAAEIQELGEK